MPVRRWFYKARLRLRTLFWRRDLEAELDEEFRFHLDQRIEQEIAQGLSPSEAKYQAIRAMEGIELKKEECRDAWGNRLLDQIQRDLRYAIRGFLRNPSFALSIIAAVAIAVGAATAVFSVVDRSLFRPLPYLEGNRLVSVSMHMPAWGSEDVMFVGAYRDWRDAQELVDLTSWSDVAACDFEDASSLRLHCAQAESTFLPILGVHPVAGRVFTAEEDQPGSEHVALVSYGMWRTTLGGDPDVIGRRFLLDGQPTRIVGVLPADFELPDLSPIDVLTPRRLPPDRARNRTAQVIGRLRPGVTAASAAAALEGPFQLFRADFANQVGANYGEGTSLQVEPLRKRQTRRYELALWMLLGAVAAFVLIACANVTNLILARTATRRQELALRAALGGSKRRLASQLLAEGALLGLIGGTLGCGLAWTLIRVFIALAPDGLPRIQQASLDVRVLAFALVLSVGTSIVLGLAPSFNALHVAAWSGSRTTTHPSTWLRQALVTAQLSVSLLLLAAAGLLLFSTVRLQQTPLGFAPDGVVTATFTLPAHLYPDPIRQDSFFQQLTTRLRAIPGAAATALTDSMPPGPGVRSVGYAGLVDPSNSPADPDMDGSVMWRYVSPAYFQALGIPIQRGRLFTDDDAQGGVESVILSEALARRIFGGADPIGRRLGANGSIVVGVVGDVRNAGLDSPADIELYRVRRPFRAGIAESSDPAWPRRATAIVRSGLGTRDAGELVRAAIGDIDPSVPVTIESMDQQLDRFLVRPRFQATLLAAFAFAGLILAAIGIYGLISFLAAGRTAEIGIRIALGATQNDITQLVLRESLRWVACGGTIGVAAALLVFPVFQGLLFQVSALDFRIIAVSAAALVAVALIAAWIPARRSAGADPMAALRRE